MKSLILLPITSTTIFVHLWLGVNAAGAVFGLLIWATMVADLLVADHFLDR